jgi:hypothetical protein
MAPFGYLTCALLITLSTIILNLASLVSHFICAFTYVCYTSSPQS